MSTIVEQQSLIDTLKGPRFYRITINGYGSFLNYIKLDRAQYDYWYRKGMEELTDYLTLQAEDEYMYDVPSYADFLCGMENGGRFCNYFYEAPTKVHDEAGVLYESMHLKVEEVDGLEWDSKKIRHIIDVQDGYDWTKQNIETEKVIDDSKPDYYVEINEQDEGDIFCGTISILGEFNFNKLKIGYIDSWCGNEIIDYILYDGETIVNDPWNVNSSGINVCLIKSQKNKKEMTTNDFNPMFSVAEMLHLGVFDGDYFHTDEQKEELKVNGKLPYIHPVNMFKPKMSWSMEHWIEKGWITPEDPLGWVQWYLRYSNGRRLTELDQHQIKRWKSYNARVTAMIKKMAAGDINKQIGTRQSLLHWGCDPIPDIDVPNKFDFLLEHFGRKK